MTAYDIDPLAAGSLRSTLAPTRSRSRLLRRCVQRRWIARGAYGDLVLVADAFYERDLAAKVTSFLEHAHGCGAAILAGDFSTTFLPRERLVALATYDVPGLLMMEGSDIKRTTIWTLRTASQHAEHATIR